MNDGAAHGTSNHFDQLDALMNPDEDGELSFENSQESGSDHEARDDQVETPTEL